MRLSTSTNIYFNRPGHVQAPIETSVRLCSDAGYRVMDMNFHDCVNFPTPFTTAKWEHWLHRLREVADSCGVEFSQGHSHFYNFSDQNVRNREWLDELIWRCIKGASILGIKWLVIHAATDFDSPTLVKSSKEKTIEYMRPTIEVAGQYGVGIALENLWDFNIAPKRRYTTTAEELVDLVDSLPYDNVGICWDFEHASIMKQNQEDALKLVGPRLKATHVSDFTCIENDHILPFSGKTDWIPIINALKEIDYQGDFTFEIHRYVLQTPDELVPSALRYSVKVGNYLLSL